MPLRQLFSGAIIASFLSLGIPSYLAASEQSVPVPAVTIYPGDLIDEAMVSERVFQPSQIGRLAIVPNRAELLGKVARRTLLPGHPVPLNAVAAPDLVKRSAPVEIVYQEGGLTILAQAMSLEAGAEGDAIRVRNLDSGAILTATVQANGTVRVGNL